MKSRGYLAIIIILLLVITGLHYYTSIYKIELHEFYRRLYYIPIILASFRYGLRGGVITPFLTGVLYAPHLLFYVGEMNIHVLNQFMEIFLFFVVGVTTGLLVQQQQDQSLELIKMEKQIHRAERLSTVGQLASGIAHEIRNPLGIIKTISQTLLKETEDNEISEGLAIIVEETNRANRVIQGLLDFARPREMIMESMDLKLLLNETVILLKKYALEHNVKIDFEVTGDISDIKGERERLKQAFINLIFNGIQSMYKGGVFRVKLTYADSKVYIRFIDEGEGIAQEILPEIFNPFFTTKSNGTGLGLSITHRIIEEHKGTIKVISKKDEGSEFIITIPVLEAKV